MGATRGLSGWRFCFSSGVGVAVGVAVEAPVEVEGGRAPPGHRSDLAIVRFHVHSDGDPMPTIRLVAAAATLGLTFPLAAMAQAPAPAPPAPAAPRVIRVSGDSRVNVRPDVAVLFTGVESTGKDLARVTKDAAGQMRRVLAAIRESGVPEKDVRTTRHDVQVERPWDKGRPGPITGYTISDEVRVTVRDLAKLGPLIERVTAAGSNSIRSLSFEKDDPTAERAQALAQAYASARAKAEALARAAGVALGEVISLSETVQGPVVPVFRGARLAAEADGAAVSAGEVEIAGSVEVTFAIR
jgi:uncharacterized protein YggE